MNREFQESPLNHAVEGTEDALSRLLAADASAHPVSPSPWFATRTAAMARALPSRSMAGAWRRWVLPMPFAALLALVLLAVQGGGLPGLTGPYTSTDSEFEQHMELLVTDLD